MLAIRAGGQFTFQIMLLENVKKKGSLDFITISKLSSLNQDLTNTWDEKYGSEFFNSKYPHALTDCTTLSVLAALLVLLRSRCLCIYL